MAVPKTIDQVNNSTNQTILTTTETIILTSPLVEIVKDNGFVIIWFYSATLPGTAATSLTLRIRKGATLSGAVIGNPQANGVTAGIQYQTISIQVDTYALAGQVQYVATAQLGAATGNSTVADATLAIMTL